MAGGEEGREELEGKAPTGVEKLKEVGIVEGREEEETVVEAEILYVIIYHLVNEPHQTQDSKYNDQ